MFPADPAVVSEARHCITAALAAWGLHPGSEFSDAVTLICSELVTNAVVHAGPDSPELTLDVAVSRSTIRLRVSDQASAAPQFDRIARPEDESGRGPLTVRLLTDDLGGHVTVTAHDDRGKTIAVELPR